MTDDPGSRVDKQGVRRAFGRAAPDYDRAAVLQNEVRSRMVERLDYVRLDPGTILDIGCGTGAGALALRKRFPRARVVAADLAEGMLHALRDKQPLLRRPRLVCADMERLPFATDSVDLVFSGLTLQWCNDLPAVFRDVRRVLREGGVFMFTTFGPGTLRELREAWAVADPGAPHVNRFVDMHEIGDALVAAGLAEPVLDVERFTLTYPDARGVMRDLRAIGARFAGTERRRGLLGKGRLRAMEAAYEAWRDGGRLPATYEVVHGHAFGVRGAGQSAAADGSVRVPLGDLLK